MKRINNSGIRTARRQLAVVLVALARRIGPRGVQFLSQQQFQ